MIEPFVRRTAGLLLIVFGAVLTLVVAARLAEWENVLAARSSVQPLGVRDMATGGIAFWAVTVTGLWWHRRRMPMWRIWSRWATFPGLFSAVFEGLQITVDRGRPIALVVAAGLGVVCWTLGEAVVLVTTRPVTAGLLASRLEIPFPTRGLKARLCVREDRLVLDSLTSRRKRSRDVIAVPWQALRSIELVNVERETVCQVLVYSGTPQANAREFDVTPGPALHIVGTARELLVPVTDRVARTVLRAVEVRSAGAQVDENELAEDEWRRKSSARRTNALSRTQRRTGVHYRTDYRPYGMIPVAAFLLMPSFMLTGMVMSLISGSKKLQKQFYVVDGVVNPWNVVILAVASIGFLYFLYRSVVKSFLRFMEGQYYIEAYPEPPARSKTETVPGSGSRKKKRRR
ncbi:hypothetical protein [Lentzea flava]|uniref:Uncharacterized protein n=1 Tax=Lentzea flava TaxID=103732 RepID=A0ABQ2UCN6_9PSEU|nr:hypothetical protein [Lentzea flava]MCP2197792.1 hypothetical protein [Lentzea flava]GGU22223.1 hypothetical protein GCM10010178_13190 [Lentzea flava]